MEDYIEYFRYQLFLLPTGDETPEGFLDYYNRVAQLKSETIRRMKYNGYPGKSRAIVNNILQKYNPNWNSYQYKISKDCRICHGIIYERQYITSDHIHCRADGGPNTIDNQQIAHAFCNVKKDSDFNKRLRNPYKLKTNIGATVRGRDVIRLSKARV